MVSENFFEDVKKQKTLTDHEMTKLVGIRSRKGSTTKARVIESWLHFSKKLFFNSDVLDHDLFLKNANKWLKNNKVNINIVEFILSAEQKTATWTIAD